MDILDATSLATLTTFSSLSLSCYYILGDQAPHLCSPSIATHNSSIKYLFWISQFPVVLVYPNCCLNLY